MTKKNELARGPLTPCPGPDRCYVLGGTERCCSHGCRVCGSLILADTEDWPAPLCIVHAPEPLIDTALALRRELERMLGLFDGAHQVDCRMWRVLGRAASDLELSSGTADARTLCSCGYFAIRQEARARFGIEFGDTRGPYGLRMLAPRVLS